MKNINNTVILSLFLISMGANAQTIYRPIVTLPNMHGGSIYSSYQDTIYEGKVVPIKWKKIDKDMLRKLSYGTGVDFTNTSDLQDRFHSVLGFDRTDQKSLSINDLKFGSGTNPNHRYGWSAEVGLQAKVSHVKRGYTPWECDPLAAKRSHKNRFSYAREIPLPGEWQLKLQNSVTSTVTNGTSFGASLGLGASLPISASTTFTVDTSKSEQTQKISKIIEVIGDPGALVPPCKTITFELFKRYLTETVQWEMPLRFRGRIGADFGKKYHGHYFWSILAEKFFYEYQWGGKYLVETKTTILPEYQVIVSIK